MNTHADKTQENKSQSVLSDHSQMQSGGESTFQFVDNRPEAVAQRKLQEMANNSPRAMQLKAFQEMANNSPEAKQAAQLQAMAKEYSAHQQPLIQKSHPLTEVAQKVDAEGLVQLAPLNNGKLNLVGESHFKDPQRKAAEKAYGERLGGGNYWPEKSFRYGADRRRGDPDNLIIGYRIDRFKRHIDDLETSYEISDVKGMLKYCKRLPNDFTSADKFPHQGEQAPMLNALVKLEKWAQGLKDSWAADHLDLNAWQSLVNKKLLFIKPEYEQLNKKYEAITKRNSERDAIDSRYARSDAMWIGAAKGGQTGLWKIGQNHVDDIKMLHGEYQAKGTYKNLREKFAQEVKMQSKGDFETEFQAWWMDNEVDFPRE